MANSGAVFLLTCDKRCRLCRGLCDRAVVLAGCRWRAPAHPPIGRSENGCGGVQCAGADVDATFVFQNTGTEVLRVRSVETSCNCTRYEIDPEDVPAGGSCCLWLSTTLPAIVGEETALEVGADVFFEGFREGLQVWAQATVVPEVPLVVDFGALLPSSPLCTQVFRVFPCPCPGDVIAVKSDHAAVAAAVVDGSPADGVDAIVEVTLTPPPDPGELVARLQIEFADGTRPPAEVAVRAMILPRVKAEPDTLLLGTIVSGEAYGYSLRLASTIGEPFEIENVTTAVPGLVCETSATDASRREYLAQVSIVAPDIRGAVAGTMTFAISDVGCPCVVVPVYGIGVPSGNADNADVLSTKRLVP